MKLLRFKDGTYVWQYDTYLSPVMNETEAVAYGVWNLKIKKEEVKLGLSNLKLFNDLKKDNVAVFGNSKKIYLYTTKHGEAIG